MLAMVFGQVFRLVRKRNGRIVVKIYQFLKPGQLLCVVCCVLCILCACGLSYFPLCHVHSVDYYHYDRFAVCQYAWAHVGWHACMWWV